jgi:hypothetical protein
MSRLSRILTWCFGSPEEINGNERCPTYVYRWRIIGGSTRHGSKTGRAIYIHHFVGDDWSLDLHDHPKRFISIGLKGSYLETTPAGQRWYRAPWIRTFPPTHAHRIQTPSCSCWTLLVTLRAVREWGFWNGGRWIPWKNYVAGESSHLADTRKSCAD